MQEKILCIQMLGGFSMYYGGEAVCLKKAGSSKSIRLLQMLLLSLPGGISKYELMENLYGFDRTDGSTRNKNLNNLIYRLKKQLTASGLPEDTYVEIEDGVSYFKSCVPLELDTRRFEEHVKKGKMEVRGG